MKNLFTAALLITATSLSANAADLSYKAAPVAQSVYNWTGFYLGSTAGGGTADADHLNVDGDFESLGGAKFQEAFGTLGFTAGHNWQIGHIVVGIEGDYNLANVDVSQNHNQDFSPTSRFQMDQFVTLRGRAGLAIDQALIYATAGVAFAHIKNSTAFNADPDFFQASDNKWKTGLAVGAGVEYALTRNWSLKGEYMLMQFSNTIVDINDVSTGRADCSSCRMNYANSIQMARVGLNYKFGY